MKRISGLFFIENGKRRSAEEAICVFCKKKFLRRKNLYRECCGTECRGKLLSMRKKTQYIPCYVCKKKVKRTVSDLKVDVNRHGFVFCSRKCKEYSQSLIGNCPNIRPKHYGSKNSYHNSLVNELKKKEGCVDCGTKTKWKLTIHHIDGDRKNNDLDNLECVCQIHHAKRHLKFINNEWLFDFNYLTPRDLLRKIEE